MSDNGKLFKFACCQFKPSNTATGRQKLFALFGLGSEMTDLLMLDDRVIELV